MRYEFLLARRLYYSGGQSEQAALSARPAVRVALLGMIIGVAVMVITICVVVGFKRTVTDKVAGFGSHIRVVRYDNNNTYDLHPIHVSDSLLTRLSTFPHVRVATPFYTVPGILKTDSAFEGVVIRATDYWDYFSHCLQSGRLPEANDEVLVSRTLADQLSLHPADHILCYFVGESIRVRRLHVVGIYATGLSELDQLFLLARPALVRQLHGWAQDEASGIEILLDDLRYLDRVYDQVYFATANRLDKEGNAYLTETLVQLHPQIFAWLDLLNMNVLVIILLMLSVAGFSIVSALIILILESVSFIAVLRALGAHRAFLRRVFLLEATMLVARGMLWGNLLGLSLCALQYFTHLLPLEAATYYVNYVPISFAWGWLLLINVLTLLASFLVLLAPSAIATRISPAQALRFD